MSEEHLASADVLHTGDYVLLKCQLRDRELYAEASDGSQDTGYICAEGLRSDLKIAPVQTFHEGGWDVREFLFKVVPALKYIAQKDLHRYKKQLRAQRSEPSSHQRARLRTFQERANAEEETNREEMNGKPRALCYGEVIQLMHVRTRRFVRVSPKLSALLQRTSRLVDLLEGSSQSYLRVNPLFRHKMQGQQIVLNEQVLLESARLGDNWNLNWARCRNMARDEILEVNCSKQGRGFYIVLYHRDVKLQSGLTGLGFSVPIRLRHHHFAGTISGSTARSKVAPYLRRTSTKIDNLAPSEMPEMCSKDLWVIEPLNMDDRGSPIQWDKTEVLVRHIASGRYLSVADPEHFQVTQGQDGSVLTQKVDSPQAQQREASPKGQGGRRTSGIRRSAMRRRASLSDGKAPRSPQAPGQALMDATPGVTTETRYNAELVQVPTAAAEFVLCRTDGAGGSSAIADPIVANNASFTLRWDDPSGTGTTLWLSCSGAPKGRRKSLELRWSETRYQRDAIGIFVVEDEDFLKEADVVLEHIKRVRYGITRRCRSFANDQNVAAMVCAQTEHALSDMIFFISGSPHWRTTEVEYVHPDALETPWVVKAQRQRLVRELKYIDATMELFIEFVKQTQGGVYREQPHDLRWGRRAATMDVRMHVRPNQSGRMEEAYQWERVMGNMITTMKTRCLKLLVRLWLFCILGSRETELYFFKNRWVDIINGLNGHGLGASDVFVAIMSNNADLARRVDRATLLKFVEFIRLLGPLDTWLSFLKAVCAPAQAAIGMKQQMVCTILVYPGVRAPEDQRETALRNREDLMLMVKLMPADTGMELGKALIGSPPSPLEQCMARDLLTYGLADIAVCWSHCRGWQPGNSDYLYHAPEAMELRVREKSDGKSWVSLADLAWVLQPERCREQTTGKKWNPDDEEDFIPRLESDAVVGQYHNSPNALKTTLARYFLAQLQLVADMVKDRQINCAMALQKEYSFSLCLCGASDPRLPTSIRAAFYNLLTDLWLDRCPHVQVVVPALNRQIDQNQIHLDELPSFELAQGEQPDHWSDEHLLSLPDEVLTFYRLTTAHKMEAVLRALRKYLCAGHTVEQQVHSAKDDNTLMLALLRLLSKLLRFGFVHSVGLVQDITGPIMRALDGRTDLLEPLKPTGRAGEKTTRELVKGGAVAVAEGFETINYAALPEPLTPLLPKTPQAAAVALGEVNTRMPRAWFPPLGDSKLRYVDIETNRSIMDSKAEMLHVALHILQLGIHTKITRVLHIFRTMIHEASDLKMARGAGILTPRSAVKAAMPQGVVEKVIKALDEPVVMLSQPGVRAPNVMCCDLMMYEDPKIFALALELLFANCCQGVEIFEKLDKVELLTAPQIELFGKIKEDMALLGKLIYAFENWGMDDGFANHDSGKFMLLQRICLNLRALCITGNSDTTPVEVQKMMNETEFFSHFDYIFKQNPLDFDPTCRPLFAKVQALMCSLASRFTASNPKNQHMIFTCLPRSLWLLEDPSVAPDCALLMVEVFRDNEELCLLVSEELIDQFGDLMKRERSQGKFVPWYISFYLTIVQMFGNGVVRNQALVIKNLKRLNPSSVLHLLQGQSGVDRVLQLAARFRNIGQLRDPEVSRWAEGEDAELIYYVRTIELLCGIACGRGSQNLVNKPFVASLFPVESILRLLVKSGAPHLQFEKSGMEAEMAPKPTISINLHLKIRWLRLLNILLYDVDKSLIDIDLLASPLHVEFFSLLCGWLETALGPALRPPPEKGGSHSVGSDMPTLGEEDEECARAMLLCVDAFFQVPYLAVKDFDICEHLVKAAQEYRKTFTTLLQNMTGQAPRVGIRDAELVTVTAYRVVAATDPKGARLSVSSQGSQQSELPRGKKPHRPSMDMTMNPKKKQRKPKQAGKGRSNTSSEMEAEWRAMLEELGDDQSISSRLRQEEAQIAYVIAHISELTDPADRTYREDLPQDGASCMPDGVDFRRNLITTELILTRFVKHVQANLRTDLPSQRRVQRVLLNLFDQTRMDGDTAALKTLQGNVVRAGLPKLLVQMLDAKVAEDLTFNAWVLMSEVLCTGIREGDVFSPKETENISLVDKAAQQSLMDVVSSGEDSGMWESVQEVFDAVSISIKTARGLRALPTWTDQDMFKASEYSDSLSYAIRIMDAVRLMVEGHFEPMQSYMFTQVGNSRSVNIPEITSALLVRLCKDPVAGDLMDEKELECVSLCLTVLTELSQGPNLRNQEFISSMGTVETVMKLLASNFEGTMAEFFDMYPPKIRRLKAQLVETMLSFMEGRHDTVIHQNILHKTDAQVLCNRIEFVHRYFIFGSAAIGDGAQQKSKGSAALPLDEKSRGLLNLGEDPFSIHEKLLPASLLAEELLEDLNDEELDELFSEALSMLEFIYNLAPHSTDFKTEVFPLEDPAEFIDDLAQFPGSESEFRRERFHHFKRLNYEKAFHFLRRFVKTIEVVLDGHLQTLHFQQPLTAMWYVHGAAKQNLLDTVELSQPDIKAKQFVEECTKMHKQSKLIRNLSRFSLVPESYVPFAQRHLPDWVHRPFQLFLANDAKRMQMLLDAALVLGVMLSLHAGAFLVPERTRSSESHGTVWSSFITEAFSFLLGGLYLGCNSLWVTLTACIKIPLHLDKQRQQREKLETLGKRKGQDLGFLDTGSSLLKSVLMDAALVWRSILVVCCALALFAETFWLYSFLLLDVFCQNRLLATVLRAITAPIRSLVMTFVGAFLVSFIYAAIGFHHFRDEFGDYCDENIITCAQNILYQTSRNGIVGLSGMMDISMPDKRDFLERMTYDMTYFVVFGIMTLNTIVGLIVDSFSALRNEQEARIANLETETFISCIERRKIESVSSDSFKNHESGFAYHENVRQNKWDYMAFIFHLREKRLQDFTGPEQAIRALLDMKDARWLPIGRSKFLEDSVQEQAGTEDVLGRIDKTVQELLRTSDTQDLQSISRAVTALNLTFKNGMEELLAAVDDVQGQVKDTFVQKDLPSGIRDGPLFPQQRFVQTTATQPPAQPPATDRRGSVGSAQPQQRSSNAEGSNRRPSDGSLL